VAAFSGSAEARGYKVGGPSLIRADVQRFTPILIADPPMLLVPMIPAAKRCGWP